MKRLPPRDPTDHIDTYVRTYGSLLRSSGEVPVRAFEEAHEFSDSSLHVGARDPKPDVAAFAYAAARLPTEIVSAVRVVMGQAHEQFEAAGYDVNDARWRRVGTRGRRRPLRWDGEGTVAAFVTSVTDIDDLVPILTAYQIEWNKMHDRLSQSALGARLADAPVDAMPPIEHERLAQALDLSAGEVLTLISALGSGWERALREIARRHQDLTVRLLSGAFTEYQRAAQRWWSGIEPVYLREEKPRRRPVYFVSSNTHALVNLIGGYSRAHQQEILEFARRRNLEDLAPALEAAIARGDEAETANITYYLLRAFLHEADDRVAERLASVQRFDAESGVSSIESPGRIDVGAQLFELKKFRADRIDSRLRTEDFELLAESDAVIVNIDYPLGMAAYHLLTRVAQGVGEVRGVYVLGKAATLNGRVGDVLISGHVYDEHSGNTYLFKNCFTADDLRGLMKLGTVLDHQKALTVLGTFQQNREYLGAFYADGYSVLEMEAGPYLSAIYEVVSPRRHPNGEIAHLSSRTQFDVGILHYASDTPYSKRQSLLSKSLSYFGVESTYACSVAILRRILRREIATIKATRG